LTTTRQPRRVLYRREHLALADELDRIQRRELPED